VRCHDDIGFGFDDNDIAAVGYNPFQHRQFLTNYYCGNHPASDAKGLPFMRNNDTGDARICGSLASLAGLEAAMESGDQVRIDLAVQKILLMHSLILSFGGIPLLYNGDALGLLNDYSFLDDASKQDDNRWVHRPKINWEQADERQKQGTIESTVFTATKKMIAVRKEISAFADFNNRELVPVSNPHLFCFIRFNHQRPSERVLVMANFHGSPQYLDLEELSGHGVRPLARYSDLFSGRRPARFDTRVVLQGYQFYWLTEV
jgi:amylosucrase